MEDWRDFIANEDVPDDVDGAFDYWEEKKKNKDGKCECGATKTYGDDATHSTWCRMFRKDSCV